MTIETVRIVNITLGIMGIIIGCMAVLASHMLPDGNTQYWNAIKDWKKIWVLNTIAIIMDVISNLAAGQTTMAAVAAKGIVEFSAYLINYGMLLLFATSMIRNMGENPDESGWIHVCHFIGVVYTLILFSSFFNHSIYWIDWENNYHRGEYFYVMWVMCAVIEIGNGFILWRRWHDLTTVVAISHLLVGGCTTIATIMQMLFYGISLVYMSISVSIVFILSFNQQAMYEQLLEQERDIVENRMQAMITQLQPHFLNNALTAIMAIEGTPPKTKKAIRDFATYLRGNLNALNKQDIIPFQRELEHIKTYINLEQLRFKDKLNVIYEIESQNFMVPPLSIQMIVENAIKHGIHPKKGMGTVRFKVAEKMGYYEICIEDDGIGFNQRLEFVDTRSHIGLRNTTYRLKKLVNGDMKVESEIGKGTKVTITIPMEDM